MAFINTKYWTADTDNKWLATIDEINVSSKKFINLCKLSPVIF